MLHADDITSGTRDVEHALEGNGPWTVRARGGEGIPARAEVVDLAGETPSDADRELLLVHTPGHTAGCVSVFCAPLRALFTGDHVCGRGKGWTEDGDARAVAIDGDAALLLGELVRAAAASRNSSDWSSTRYIRDTDDP